VDKPEGQLEALELLARLIRAAAEAEAVTELRPMATAQQVDPEL
jgi:hypothetical protein